MKKLREVLNPANTPADIVHHFETHPDPGSVIEVDSGPDRDKKYGYFLYWLTDYIPGHPEREHGCMIRGQRFLSADPDQHGARLEIDRRYKSTRWPEGVRRYPPLPESGLEKKEERA